MRGASRASLADARERLAAADAGAELGDELFAVVRLLDGQPRVRRALADSASAPAAREGLAAAVLGGQLSQDAVALVSSVAASRWSGPGDLVDALEQLAVLAVVAGAEREGRLDDLEDDLFRFGRVVRGHSGLRSALSDPFAPASAKRELIGRLLAGKATPEAIALITQAAAQARGRSLEDSLEAYAQLAAEQRRRLIAEVRVAVELSLAQRRRLADVLARRYGRDVQLNFVIDPRAVGGLSIRIGDDQVDGTIATRLADVRHGLTA
jgi:F-type H+-transporting ATPase subunit delta